MEQLMRERFGHTYVKVARAGMATMATLCVLAAGAAAQEQLTEAPPVEPLARYTVEIIVFSYADASSAGNEVFTPPEPLYGEPTEGELAGNGSGEGPVFDDRLPMPSETDPEPPSGALEEIPARGRIELERLEPESFRLQETWRKLQRLDAYRPILHAAWTQTTHDKSVSPALPLRTLSDPPLGLDGSISLYQSRFLHLDVDLTLDASGYTGGDARRTATDRLVRGDRPDTIEQDGVTGEMAPAPVRYRITEDRIMRDGEVRYFDHPRFGMIATVSRVAEGPPADTPAL